MKVKSIVWIIAQFQKAFQLHISKVFFFRLDNLKIIFS